MTATALEILKTVFGYDAFRGPQARIVENVIAGNNAFVLMPTGGGKSLSSRRAAQRGQPAHCPIRP